MRDSKIAISITVLSLMIFAGVIVGGTSFEPTSLEHQIGNSVIDFHELAVEDTTPPEIYLHPENMTVLKGSGTITLTWAVRDDISSSGGYFIDVKIPEISGMWLTMQTYLWYSEQSITFSLDTSEEYVYFIRFKAHDEAINFAEHIIQVTIAKELDPPTIECTHEVLEDGGININYSIKDNTGISCIVINYTYQGVTFELLTNNVAEPKNNKEINGLAGLGAVPMSYRIYAKDYYGTWGDSGDITVIEPSTTEASTGTTETNATNTGLPLVLEPATVNMIVGFATGGVLIVLLYVVLIRRRTSLN